MRGTRVWDWPVRTFHWALVVLLIAAWVTAQGPLTWMVWHMRIGYAVMFLLVFRVLWGLWGTSHARFGDFLYGPRAVARYARALLGRRPDHHAGHTPLGGWMVLALLALVGMQVGSGLFASDGIMTDGPLRDHVSRTTSKWLTRIHHINVNVLLAAAALHVAAVLGYLLVLRDNLIVPMITGRKRIEPAGADVRAPWWRVAAAAVGAALVTWCVVG